MTDAARDLNEATAPLRRRVVLAYGIGDAGTGMASALVGFYLFVFYTAVAGLPAWLAGSVLMVVRLWDVFSDQLIGWLGDRTRHRLGPRVPWMLWGALPLGATMALMWWIPPFTGPWRLGWFVLIAALFQMSYSLVNLPYSAMPAELTANVALCTRLVSARFSGSVLASLVGLLLGASLTSPGGSWLLATRAGGWAGAEPGKSVQCHRSGTGRRPLQPSQPAAEHPAVTTPQHELQPLVPEGGGAVSAALECVAADAARCDPLPLRCSSST